MDLRELQPVFLSYVNKDLIFLGLFCGGREEEVSKYMCFHEETKLQKGLYGVIPLVFSADGTVP